MRFVNGVSSVLAGKLFRPRPPSSARPGEIVVLVVSPGLWPRLGRDLRQFSQFRGDAIYDAGQQCCDIEETLHAAVFFCVVGV